MIYDIFDNKIQTRPQILTLCMDDCKIILHRAALEEGCFVTRVGEITR
jgi:hypothetical protein